MNCPKCGDELFYSSSTQQEFKCLTLVLKDGRTFEGGDCAKRQRDQLAQRVNELEGEVADYRKLSCDWKAYATNLESVGKQMLDGGFHAPHIISQWREAEDTRP